ncbi:hypothetical protein V8C86DRAFT_2681379 [Haematococcus lacustris]
MTQQMLMCANIVSARVCSGVSQGMYLSIWSCCSLVAQVDSQSASQGTTAASQPMSVVQGCRLSYCAGWVWQPGFTNFGYVINSLDSLHACYSCDTCWLLTLAWGGQL